MIVMFLVNCYVLFYAVLGIALMLRGLGLWGDEQSPARMQGTRYKSR